MKLPKIATKRFRIPDLQMIRERVSKLAREWDNMYSEDFDRRYWTTGFRPKNMPYKKLGISKNDHLVFICGGIGEFAKKAMEDGHYVEYTDASQVAVDLFKKSLVRSKLSGPVRKQIAEDLSAKTGRSPLIIGIEPYPLTYDPESSLLMILRMLAHGRGGLIIERHWAKKLRESKFDRYLEKLSRIYGFKIEEGTIKLKDNEGIMSQMFRYIKLVPSEEARVKAFHDLQMINSMADRNSLTEEELKKITSLQDVREVLERIDKALSEGEKLYERLKLTKYLEVK